jgi:hypothetical protein
MNPGDVFFLPDWGGGHINFVIEVFSDGSILVCNFTDDVRGVDRTCVVNIGDHPNITKASVVNFPKIDHCETGLPLDALTRLIESRKAPLSPELLVRIRQGVLDSPRVPPKIKSLLKPNK